jgi:hypothetical protein
VHHVSKALAAKKTGTETHRSSGHDKDHFGAENDFFAMKEKLEHKIATTNNLAKIATVLEETQEL